MEWSEIFKVASPFIILIITTVIIPYVKNRSNLKKTFFDLPAAEQIDAIDYIKSYQPETKSLSVLAHRIKMKGYKLDEDKDFSSKLICFYYNNQSKNRRFSEKVLKIRGMYSYDKGKITFNGLHVLFLLCIIALPCVSFWVWYTFYNPISSSTVLTFSFMLLSIIIVQAFLIIPLVYRTLNIFINKRRFNKFNQSLADKS